MSLLDTTLRGHVWPSLGTWLTLSLWAYFGALLFCPLAGEPWRNKRV